MLPSVLPPKEEMAHQIQRLAIARARLHDAQTKKVNLLENIMQSPEYRQLADEIGMLVQEETDIDANLRKLAVNYFETYGNKKPHCAIVIRQNNIPRYDLSTALIWAKEHLLKAVKPETLDKAFFEKHARAVAETDPIELVSWEIRNTATISEDLSEYLPGRATDEEKAAGSSPASGQEDEIPF